MLQWTRMYENDPYMASNNVTSIDTHSTTARFRYSPFFGNAIKDVTLDMTGSYYGDFKALNNAYYGGMQPADTTWHHVFMTNFNGTSCQMQLVERDLHNYTKTHMGSAAQYRNLHPGTYKSIHNVNKSGKLYIIDGYYTPAVYYAKKDIHEISSIKGLVMPETLKRFYNNESSIIAGKVEIPIQEDYVLNYIDPLTEGNIYLKDEGESYNTGGNIPFAGDPFGNIFYLDSKEEIYFYNHETGQDTSLGISITDIIN